jgi:[protein-PII] uridylyltransferase
MGDLEAAYGGRLALAPRVERKALDYLPSSPIDPDVRILNDVSPHSTVIEVRANDALGLLYVIASAITELDLDIHTAKVDTLGERVVDAFYVRTAWGAKLEGSQALETSEAIRHRVKRFFES